MVGFEILMVLFVMVCSREIKTEYVDFSLSCVYRIIARPMGASLSFGLILVGSLVGRGLVLLCVIGCFVPYFSCALCISIFGCIYLACGVCCFVCVFFFRLRIDFRLYSFFVVLFSFIVCVIIVCFCGAGC